MNFSEIKRRKSRKIMVGSVPVGGDAPISVQSMTNTDTQDVAATLNQIRAIAAAGADIVRVSVPSMKAAEAFKEIRSGSPVPVVADIHFDYRIALKVAEYGADCLRINPGNIGSEDKIRAVVEAARERHIPIRIGVNGGSLERDLLERYGEPVPEALVESAMRHVDILDRMDFPDFKVSVKASNVFLCYEAYRLLASRIDQPLSMGLSWLLREGIGDTLRVSLAADPVEEVKVGFDILKGLGIRSRGISFVACPTCSRRGCDVIGLVNTLEERLSDITANITVAVMGCIVNGPGEAMRANLGICGAKDRSVYYEDGQRKELIPNDDLLQALEQRIRDYVKNHPEKASRGMVE